MIPHPLTLIYRLIVCYNLQLQMKKAIYTLAILPLTFGSLLGMGGSQDYAANERVIAQKEMSLDNRNGSKFVNDVFKDNILLNLAYLDGRIRSPEDINWAELNKPFKSEFKLYPLNTFAFHEDIKEQYRPGLVQTTNAHFNSSEGFKTDGYLFGDGICHLASLINWVARQAGLSVEAPTNHDFANIPDIPREYGVSIYNNPNTKEVNKVQNLYITNNRTKPIAFRFEYANNKVKVSVVEEN